MIEASEIIMNCLKKQNMTQRELAAKLREDPRILNKQLKRDKDIKFGRVQRILNLIGYELQVVEKIS